MPVDSPGRDRRLSDGVLFAGFAVVMVTIGVLSPHFAWGHLPVPQAVGQSAVVLADSLLLLVGFRLYLGRVRQEERIRRQAEHNMVNSYRYIGVANRRIEMFSEFVERAASADNPTATHEGIGSLLPQIAVSLIGVDAALLRIIDRESGRTVTEWRYGGAFSAGRLRIHNRAVMAGSDSFSREGMTVVDRPDGLSTVAVLVAGAADIDESSERFLRTMIRFLHLAFHSCTCRTHDAVQVIRDAGNGIAQNDNKGEGKL